MNHAGHPSALLAALGAAAERVLARTIELAAVPGPPLDEADRAAVVERWWRADSLYPVMRDDIGNVWARVRQGRADGAVVVAAHLDTVFGRTVPHGVVRDGDRLRGPGVGDDTVALAALATLATLLGATDRSVWILATVGEEGLGDLAGIRFALEHPPEPIAACIAIEGNYLGRVCTTAVGSRRYRVEVTAPGGHSWEAAAAPSAVHAAARLTVALAALAAPDGTPKQAVNVGVIRGGEAVNARARACTFELDLRSDDADGLRALDAGLRDAVADVAHDGVHVELVAIGARPAGRIGHDAPLVEAARAGLAAIGRAPAYVAASTDANAAHAAGVPAIAIGVTEGAGEHTEEEWIAVPPLVDGLWALAVTVSAAASVPAASSAPR